MKDLNQQGEFLWPDNSLHDLVDALNTLRDRLLDAAMALRDYQFETDKVQRGAADEATAALIDRANARPR